MNKQNVIEKAIRPLLQTDTRFVFAPQGAFLRASRCGGMTGKEQKADRLMGRLIVLYNEVRNIAVSG